MIEQIQNDAVVQLTRELGKAEWDENMTYAMSRGLDGNVIWLMPK